MIVDALVFVWLAHIPPKGFSFTEAAQLADNNNKSISLVTLAVILILGTVYPCEDIQLISIVLIAFQVISKEHKLIHNLSLLGVGYTGI
jgi:hypothetical protein